MSIEGLTLSKLSPTSDVKEVKDAKFEGIGTTMEDVEDVESEDRENGESEEGEDGEGQGFDLESFLDGLTLISENNWIRESPVATEVLSRICKAIKEIINDVEPSLIGDSNGEKEEEGFNGEKVEEY